MIIDFHTHIFTDSLAQRAISNLETKGNIKAFLNGKKDDLIKSMNRAGIDISVAQPVLTKPSQTAAVNRWAAEETSKRLKFFAGFHPKDENYKQTLREIKAMGFAGVKLHPDYQDFFVDDPKYFDVFTEIFGNDLTVLIHGGLDVGFKPPYHCTPERVAKLIDSIETGRIVIAHLGGHMMWDKVERCLAGRDIYLDTSMGTRYYDEKTLLRIIEKHGADRVLFGTDSPWEDQRYEAERIKSILPPDAADKVLHKNAEKLLGIN